MQVIVKSIELIAEKIRGFVLVPNGTEALPVFDAGSHIDVVLPIGLTRQYSLYNLGAENRYRIGVNLDADSRGGSTYMHESITPGDVLEISEQRNNFPLDEAAPFSVLIAGGIGITPIFAMVQRLADLGKKWRLYHCAPSTARTPFMIEALKLADTTDSDIIYVHDGMPGIQPLDIKSLIGEAPKGTHFYCCGPQPMMDAFAKATASLPDRNIHTEYFASADLSSEDDESFVVECTLSGKSLVVHAGETILEALEKKGLAPLCSCREGICGTCETKVLAGTPDHRDLILTPDEKTSNTTMMICVSRAQGNKLTLEI